MVDNGRWFPPVTAFKVKQAARSLEVHGRLHFISVALISPLRSLIKHRNGHSCHTEEDELCSIFKTLDNYCDKMNKAWLMTQITKYRSDCFSCELVMNEWPTSFSPAPSSSSNHVRRRGEFRECIWGITLVFVGGDSQYKGHIWVLQVSLDYAVELFPVLIELHDAFRFFGHPEFIKFICQITWKRWYSEISLLRF